MLFYKKNNYGEQKHQKSGRKCLNLWPRRNINNMLVQEIFFDVTLKLKAHKNTEQQYLRLTNKTLETRIKLKE